MQEKNPDYLVKRYFSKINLLQRYFLKFLHVVSTYFPVILTSCPLFSLSFGWVQQQRKSTQKWVEKSGQLASGKEVLPVK